MLLSKMSHSCILPSLNVLMSRISKLWYYVYFHHCIKIKVKSNEKVVNLHANYVSLYSYNSMLKIILTGKKLVWLKLQS